MLKKIISITTIALLSFTVIQTPFPERAYKKLDKTIGKLWNNKTITRKAILINSPELGFKVYPNSLFKLYDGHTVIAYAYLGKANSKSAQFDYVVFFNPELKIIYSQVLIYREDYGGEIGSNRWLKQFNGKYNGQAMVFQKDIQNISGATISSRNITQGIQQLSKQIVILKQKGFLD